ncbi:MAG TPA: TRAP transporter small permease [Rhodospirillales bacterium]|nr:TRAP transporter small permease [Rhodospirillales bacterium]
MTNETSGASPLGGALSSLLDRALSSLNALGSIWIFFIMALVNADVIGRNLFLAPIDGVNEIIELSLVGIVFLQLGDATRHGRLTRSDGFFNFMLRRKPRIGRKMGVVFDLLGAFFMGLILWGATPLLIESWEGDFYEGQEGVFTAPVWPVNLVIVVGCFLTLLLFLRMAWRYLRPDDSIIPKTPDAVT